MVAIRNPELSSSEAPDEAPPGAVDPATFAEVARLLDAISPIYFRYQLRLGALPDPPCLFVGNHSGFGFAEVFAILGRWHRYFGTSRPVTGLTHDALMRLPVVGDFLRPLGAVPASFEHGLAALKAGRDVLVFPGGDRDACRPFYRAREVDFGPRRGYVKLALAAGVPVVPVATIGSSYTLPMLPGGAALSRALGLKHFFRIERLPLTTGLMPQPFGMALALGGMWAATRRYVSARTGMLAFLCGVLPFPARITTEVLPAIDLRGETAHLSDERERLEHGHRLVLDALRQAVAVMRHDRPLRG